MPLTSQLPLPLEAREQLGRKDFIAAPGNEAALSFIDSWPVWPAKAAALYGPAASGKSHLAAIWRAKADAIVLNAADLTAVQRDDQRALVIEDVDGNEPSEERDLALLALFDHGANFLLTGRDPPSVWRIRLPDLASRFSALPAFPLGAPDDALLSALIVKLFADRQLTVPETIAAHILNALERSPGAVRDFIVKADTYALSLHRKITPSLIRELLAAMGKDVS